MQAAEKRASRLVIDLEKIEKNYQALMATCPAGTKGIAVVKADAYGHGVIPVAEHMEKQADLFAVALLDEGLDLREAGIERDIFVLGYTPAKEVRVAAEAGIALTVTSLDWLKEAKKFLDRQVLVHIKVDSGMSRLGLRSLEEVQALVDYISQHPDFFRLESIFTHFATADSKEEAHRQQVHQQYNRFVAIKEGLDFSDLSQDPFFHCSNSATTIWHPNLTLDAVRLGVAMYGINPSNGVVDLPSDLTLEPALSLESELVFVKQMQEGDKVSYGAIYEAQENEWIATLPIGYADGWQRRYGDKICALVDGQVCPFVGRICMDQCMIRLPAYYPPHTPVTLIGQNRNKQIRAEDLADSVGTIAYEVLCLFSDRLKREYVGQGVS